MQIADDSPPQPTLAALVKHAMQARGMSAADLSRATGRSESRISWMLQDGYKLLPPPTVLADLRRVLGIPMAAMMRAYGYDPDADRARHMRAPRHSDAGRALDPTSPDAPRAITHAMVDDLAAEDIALVQQIMSAVLKDRERRDTLIRAEREPAERSHPAGSTNGVRVL